jgi:AbrB family looped-hinge helix DNA binding protein
MVLTRVTSEGQITVPKAVRERLGIQPGDALDFHFQGERLAVRAVRRRQLAVFRGIFPVSRAVDHAEERAAAWAERGRQ